MRELSTKQLKAWIEAKKPMTIVDARTRLDFAKARIPGAINLRWKYVHEKARHKLPDKNAVIVTYCQSFLCDASTKAYQTLKELGYRRLYEYSGGINDWKAHGNPVLSSSRRKKKAAIKGSKRVRR